MQWLTVSINSNFSNASDFNEGASEDKDLFQYNTVVFEKHFTKWLS